MGRPLLATMTWTDVTRTDVTRSDVTRTDVTGTDVAARYLVVPVGSCEQHGPHLPLHTDTVIASALAEDLAGRRPDCVVAPAITITASGEHAGFPGTLSIGTEAMASVVIELARSATWVDGVVFVNGHGGNAMAMRRAEEVFTHERRAVLIWWPSVPDGDPHAGHTETSIMLSIAPAEVRVDRMAAGPVPAMVDLVNHGVRPLSATGVLGDPTNASAADGTRIFEMLARKLAGDVDAWIATLDSSGASRR